MYKWSKKSSDLLATCDNRLQDLANMMLERSEFDLTITDGYRTKDEQEKAFNDGKSRAKFGKSKHNVFPSQAIDIVPYPIDWNTKNPRWNQMALNAMWCAGRLGIEITWGGNFVSLKDLPHFELKG